MLLAILEIWYPKMALLFLTSLAFALVTILFRTEFSTSFQVLLINAAIVALYQPFSTVFLFFDGQGPTTSFLCLSIVLKGLF